MNIERDMMENKGKDFDEFGPEDFKELDIPERVSRTEAIIFNWVAKHFDINEAMDPSWNITMLADEIDAQQQNPKFKMRYTVAYQKLEEGGEENFCHPDEDEVDDTDKRVCERWPNGD